MKRLVKALEETGLLIKGVSKAVEIEVKEQKIVFLGMLAATLACSLLGDMLMNKGVIRAGEGMIRAVEVTNRTVQDF